MFATGSVRRTRPTTNRKAAVLATALLSSLLVLHVPATALAQQSPQVYSWEISAGPLEAALTRLAARAKLAISYSQALVAGKATRGVSGQHTPEEALRRLLEGTGLTMDVLDEGTFALRPDNQAQSVPTTPLRRPASASVEPAEEPAIQDLERVAVTGTRIRGGVTPSPVITVGSERIREEGYSDLGEVIRSIPQNFSGGQNPGIAAGATGGGVANQNITGGSGLNLRGLGPDASLTLLNGRRMSYGSFAQMVDISAIPVEAVERIEIVADGASAIYGSDAVGGVGNVILRRDFDGVTIGARYGHATDGGLATREYTATAGATWATGGLIATWKKSSNDPIYSDQRDYTEGMYRPSTLYQGGDLRSGLLSAHQSLGGLVTLRLDALRTEREILTDMAYATNYEHYTPETVTSLVSPGIEFLLPNDWTLSVGGAWGKDETQTNRSVVTLATGASTASRGCYCNESRVYEASAEGPLFALGGGDARLAVGAGYRHNDFMQINTSGAAVVDGEVRSRFAYAELNLPLIGASQNISGVRRLALTGAMRAEDYDSFGGVTTPKLGLIYGPSDDFTLKASWGKSFKAPTLSLQYSSQNAYLYPAAALGGAGYPAGATVLYLAGGNPDLNPERARTWSASLAFHPEALPGLEAELTWFDIDYTDRVERPINPGQALSNPLYADFIVHSPTAAQQASLLEAYTLINVTGAPYDPGNVVALAPNLYINMSRQWVQGLDLTGSYRFDLADGRLTIRGSASWLDSKRQISPAQGVSELTGTLFYPAKVNARAGAVWNRGGFTASVFGNYTSGSTNPTDGRKGASFTTFDANLRYDTGERGDPWSDLAFELSARNALDRAPPLYTTTSPTFTPYDSTNYSAIGRYMSISVSKHW